MIKVVSFEPAHMAKVAPREVHSTELLDAGIMPETPLHTFLVEDKPIAIFGGAFIHAKYFQAWAFLSEEITQYPIEFARKTRRLLDVFMRHHGLERLEITVRSDYPIGQRFACALGFGLEGVMRRYGRDGADYHLFARVKWPTQ